MSHDKNLNLTGDQEIVLRKCAALASRLSNASIMQELVLRNQEDVEKRIDKLNDSFFGDDLSELKVADVDLASKSHLEEITEQLKDCTVEEQEFISTMLDSMAVEHFLLLLAFSNKLIWPDLSRLAFKVVKSATEDEEAWTEDDIAAANNLNYFATQMSRTEAGYVSEFVEIIREGDSGLSEPGYWVD
jgi:predicted DNA-binding protein